MDRRPTYLVGYFAVNVYYSFPIHHFLVSDFIEYICPFIVSRNIGKCPSVLSVVIIYSNLDFSISTTSDL